MSLKRDTQTTKTQRGPKGEKGQWRSTVSAEMPSPNRLPAMLLAITASREVICAGDRACPFPGPFCLGHFRMLTEPEIFTGWYSPTRQLEDALVLEFGVEFAPAPGEPRRSEERRVGKECRSR